MRKISATTIYPITSPPITNGVITIKDDGTIVSIDTKKEAEDVEFYEGIICPGFINTHCHIELSHLKGVIDSGTGMGKFISDIISKRNDFTEENIINSISNAESEMIQNGIVAVGDISNTNNSFTQKKKQNIFYHTFIEAFDLIPGKANETYNAATILSNELIKLNLNHSIVPHAPYTVSDELFELISKHAIDNNSILSIHNQESKGEDELFSSNSGELYDTFSVMGIDLDHISKSGLSSLRSIFPKLPTTQKTLLVHNTFTSADDVRYMNDNAPNSTFWCTCPNANKYITNTLPNYEVFINNEAKITIGTDSLASNWSLSILDELKTITKHNPKINTNTLLTWATNNGAEFLNLSMLGSIEAGKKPGLNLLKNTPSGKITESTEIRVL